MKELNKKWRIKNKRETALQRGDRRQILSHTQHSYHMYTYDMIRILCILYVYRNVHTKKHTINARIQMRVHTCHVYTRVCEKLPMCM